MSLISDVALVLHAQRLRVRMFAVSRQLEAQNSDARRRQQPGVRPMRLLLVEDNAGDVRLTHEALATTGANTSVEVVPDGAEAMRYLRGEEPYSSAERPDLILLDLNLPKVGGQEVLRFIKTDPNLRRIPVIVWTTSRSPQDVTTAYENHANCCVTKPSDWDSFQRLIDAAQRFWFGVVTLPSQ